MKEEKLFRKKENNTAITDLLDCSRVMPREYQELIAKQNERGGNYTTAHSLNWEDVVSDDSEAIANIKRTIDLFKEHLSGDVLVDLGAGSEKVMEELSKKFGVRTYVKVDKFYKLQSSMTIAGTDIAYKELEADRLHLITVNSDMLDFISRVRDNSGSFVLNGIDDYVINSVKYQEMLAREIIRATRSKGIIFGINSDSVSYYLAADSRIEKIDSSSFFPSSAAGAFFFRKK